MHDNHLLLSYANHDGRALVSERSPIRIVPGQLATAHEPRDTNHANHRIHHSTPFLSTTNWHFEIAVNRSVNLEVLENVPTK
jgi:hypothetical protein